MTWAWSLQWTLLNPNGKPTGNVSTMNYIEQLAMDLTSWEYNYSELMWRFGGILPSPPQISAPNHSLEAPTPGNGSGVSLPLEEAMTRHPRPISMLLEIMNRERMSFRDFQIFESMVLSRVSSFVEAEHWEACVKDALETFNSLTPVPAAGHSDQQADQDGSE